MNILVSNDDGYFAYGIHKLCEGLAAIGPEVNIYICAPDRQRSCNGHSFTYQDPLYVKEIKEHDFCSAVKWVYTCSGTPADCARMGLFLAKKSGIDIDLVCSGINHGQNLGTDIYYSGTMAAAREAALCGVQAIAFSICSFEPVHFELFDKLIPHIVKKAYGRLAADTILNVNVPDLPKYEIMGTKVCTIGPMAYNMGYFELRKDAEGSFYQFGGGTIEPEFTEGTRWDSALSLKGYITLTPIKTMPRDPEAIKNVEALEI